MVAAAHYPDPQTLYDPDPQLKNSIIIVYAAPVVGLLTGLSAYAGFNYVRHRPLKASIPMYIIWGLGFGGSFEAMSRLMKRYYSRRDTIFKHYIQLHPEDFKPPPKVKIADLLEDWNPTR